MAHEATSDPGAALLAEIQRVRTKEGSLERDILQLRAQREGLERAYLLVTGQPVAGSVSGAAAAPRRGARSRAVAERREAMARVLRAHGPTGPQDLLDAVRSELADPAITRAQITDVLRRMDDVFESLGDGTWGLTQAHLAGSNGRAKPDQEEAMP